MVQSTKLSLNSQGDSHLPSMICSRWICLVKAWSTIIVKSNNKCRNAKWTATIALGVALLKKLLYLCNLSNVKNNN